MDRQFWLGLVLGGAGALALVGLLAPERSVDVAKPQTVTIAATPTIPPSPPIGGGPIACACPTIDPLTEFFRGALPSECFASPAKSCEPRAPVVWWWPLACEPTMAAPTLAASIVAAPIASSAEPVAIVEEPSPAPSTSASAAPDASLEWDPFAPVVDPWGPNVPP